jgi:hypothetical protein
MTASTPAPSTLVRPFTVAISDSEIEDLKQRLARTRWPNPETAQGRGVAKGVARQSQECRLATVSAQLRRDSSGCCQVASACRQLVLLNIMLIIGSWCLLSALSRLAVDVPCQRTCRLTAILSSGMSLCHSSCHLRFRSGQAAHAAH